MASLFQIHIDIPRTNPLIPLFQQPLVQEVREVLNVLGPSPPDLSGTCSAWKSAVALPPTMGRFTANRDGTLFSDMELWSFPSLFSCILI